MVRTSKSKRIYFHLRCPASAEDTVLKVQEFTHLYAGDELGHPSSGERIKVLKTPVAAEVKVSRGWMGTKPVDIKPPRDFLVLRGRETEGA